YCSSYLSYRISPHYSYFYNGPSPPYIYTLSLHDALPISHLATPAVPTQTARASVCSENPCDRAGRDRRGIPDRSRPALSHGFSRSEEHTSELQSRGHLVCRLLLEKKKE